MATKRTSDLIPLCHPIPITGVDVEYEFEPEGVRVKATGTRFPLRARISPNGTRLVMVGNRTARIWRTDSKETGGIKSVNAGLLRARDYLRHQPAN